MLRNKVGIKKMITADELFLFKKKKDLPHKHTDELCARRDFDLPSFPNETRIVWLRV
jgi:hypothetical protein